MSETPAPANSQIEQTEPSTKAVAKRGALRRLYDWTIHWADTKYALPALIILSFTESSFFPIPPDVLLLAMCFTKPKKWFLYAFWCTVASAVGGVFGWLIGWGLYESVGKPIVEFYSGGEKMAAAQALYDEWGAVAVLVAAITPIPYKIFTIASGVFHYSPWSLFVFSLVGRGIRFFAVALLIRFFGVRIRKFLEKHFEWASFVFVILAVLGFLALKFLKH